MHCPEIDNCTEMVKCITEIFIGIQWNAATTATAHYDVLYGMDARPVGSTFVAINLWKFCQTFLRFCDVCTMAERYVYSRWVSSSHSYSSFSLVGYWRVIIFFSPRKWERDYLEILRKYEESFP